MSFPKSRAGQEQEDQLTGPRTGSTRGRRLTVLVDQHPEGDAVGVKAVEEVLHVAADEGVEAKLLLVLDDALSHGGNHVVVPVTDLDQQLQETTKMEDVWRITASSESQHQIRTDF